MVAEHGIKTALSPLLPSLSTTAQGHQVMVHVQWANALRRRAVGGRSTAKHTWLLATHCWIDPSPPLGVHFNGGGTWNQNDIATTTITINNFMDSSGYGMCTGGNTLALSSVHMAACHSPSHWALPSSGVYYGVGGTWNQNGAITITTNSSTESSGYGTGIEGPMHCAGALIGGGTL
jgi:hypothetical protein